MLRNIFLALSLSLVLTLQANAQSVCLPAPRLLTVMPMGGQVGTTVEVTITSENAEEITELMFSTPKITAKPAVDGEGKPVANKFLLTIAKDAPLGVHDVRLMSRLGISSARAFSVGKLSEVTQTEANTTLETAMAISTNAICNATMTARAIDYYSFQAKKDQRFVIECAAKGIDSKLTPVVILADAEGNDLMVNRTGGIIDFTPPADGDYTIKVNDLTYQGSGRHFYRLALHELAANAPVPLHPSTSSVSSMSWPPVGLPEQAAGKESEPNNEHYEAQKITLPCDLSGGFYPAADVDTFEFSAKKGEVWWVEVASERLGLPTDPFVLVQKVDKKGDEEVFTDVAELYDIKPPLKVSSNGYSYDGPPYNAGSPDVLGKVEIKEDGTYRLQVRDLFGGTRDEPSNVYRLIVRKPQPDFSLAAWAVHMTLRNGDRAAYSKPMALRAGGAMAIEVAVIRRDGFDGEIELAMDGLPEGVSASGLRIPAGANVGHVIVSADETAKRGMSLAKMIGSATIDGKAVTRPCRLASMEWPVKDAKQEIPEPRLVANVPVSVTTSEKAPLSIVAKEEKVWEAIEGEKLTIPLKPIWREEFSGTSVKLKTYGDGFTKVPDFEIPLKKTEHDVVIDLAALKAKPGDYTIAFYGGAVAKYRYNPAAVAAAEAEAKKAEEQVAVVAAEAKKLGAAAANAPTDQKTASANAAKIAAEKQKQAEAAKVAAEKKMKTVTAAAAPKDIVDIVVSEPIRISVKPKPAEAKPAETAAAR
jgi:hypothetical protein